MKEIITGEATGPKRSVETSPGFYQAEDNIFEDTGDGIRVVGRLFNRRVRGEAIRTEVYRTPRPVQEIPATARKYVGASRANLESAVWSDLPHPIPGKAQKDRWVDWRS